MAARSIASSSEGHIQEVSDYCETDVLGTSGCGSFTSCFMLRGHTNNATESEADVPRFVEARASTNPFFRKNSPRHAWLLQVKRRSLKELDAADVSNRMMKQRSGISGMPIGQ